MTDPVIPNFICPGAQKAGTTSLYQILRRHPDIFLPVAQKEIHYFDRDINFERGLTWYAQHYLPVQNEKIIGDISPDYMLFEYVAPRILDSLGAEVKILFLLRHPVDRAYSQYNYHRFFQVEKNHSFAEALKNDADSVPTRFGSWHTPPYYVFKSRYCAQISRFLQVFSKQSIHVAVFEDLFGTDERRAKQATRDIFTFLGVADMPAATGNRVNPTFVPKHPALFDTMKARIAPGLKRLLSAGQYKALRTRCMNLLQNKHPALTPHTRRHMLNQYFLDDIKRLEACIGRGLNVWYDQ